MDVVDLAVRLSLVALAVLAAVVALPCCTDPLRQLTRFRTWTHGTGGRPHRPRRRPPGRRRRSACCAVTRRDVEVPILMYHVLGDPPADVPYPELYVRSSDFRGQLAWLDRHGYTAVTLGAVWDHWHGRKSLPPKPIVISVDDGFRDTFTVALPALRRARVARSPQPRSLSPRRRWGLSRRRVRVLITEGWEIGAHTLTHPDLTTVSDDRLEREVAGSRSASWSAGSRFRSTSSATRPGATTSESSPRSRRAGYLGATTHERASRGRTSAFTLGRVRVSRDDDLADFAASLTAVEGAALAEVELALLGRELTAVAASRSSASASSSGISPQIRIRTRSRSRPR